MCACTRVCICFVCLFVLNCVSVRAIAHNDCVNQRVHAHVLNCVSQCAHAQVLDCVSQCAHAHVSAYVLCICLCSTVCLCVRLHMVTITAKLSNCVVGQACAIITRHTVTVQSYAHEHTFKRVPSSRGTQSLCNRTLTHTVKHVPTNK